VQSREEEGTTLAAVTADGRVLLAGFQRGESLLGEEGELEQTVSELAVTGRVTHLALDVDQRELYLVTDDGHLHYYDVQDKEAPRLLDVVTVAPAGGQVTALEFLAGGISVLVGDSTGRIEQWFPVRDASNNYHLAHVRGFRLGQAPITAIAPEFYRKGFLAADAAGVVGIFHTTAGRTLLWRQAADGPITLAAMLPHADGALLVDGSESLQRWSIHNEHPEVSWRSLWGKVWYESRQQPEWIWQSSSASNDFEPKFSLTPLAFGTLKATFYAMLFAIPLGVLGALFAGYFMHPAMRKVVKPTVEVMAALPTVILGFLAGLWLAPLVEHNLPGIFLILLLTPLSLVAAGWGWDALPEGLRRRVPEGLEAALLIPVVVLTIWLSMVLGHPLEDLLFDGNMPAWITSELGIDFDQRNSLVVGIAMGFAVIPTIFSISEDGVHSVPRHLVHGSLALGATPWQTLWRVVLPTASPAIFSALMIGLGRAVGETMIVLMATGNTPVVDFNIFTGFRALSANIAVEMPETEVHSTHYRVLFLAALVLFLATFLVNTAGEIVRQRLRRRYSSL
ncbi:MAG: ABC transporter permease subunit, partial [Gammaproteobacteria bacterium]